MPSPPLAPDDGPIDFDHLKRMTLGDAGLEQEVLAMFSAQSAGLVDQLMALPTDAPALAHTLKGSFMQVGNSAAGVIASQIEDAARNKSVVGTAVLVDQLEVAFAELESVLRRRLISK